MGKIRNVFIKQHQRGRWRYHWGLLYILGELFNIHTSLFILLYVVIYYFT